MDAATTQTMTREHMLAIQAVPSRPIIRVHSCTCGQIGRREDMHTWPLIRSSPVREPVEYRCSRCGRIC